MNEIDKPAPRRGRPPKLDVNLIVNAALQRTRLLGLDGYSMKDLAADLDAAEMSLYHHVATRFELDQLVVQGLAAQLVLPTRQPGETSGDWLMNVARLVRGVLDEHHGVAQHLLAHGPSGPMLPIMGDILSALEEHGVQSQRLARSYSILTTTIIALSMQRNSLAGHVGGDALFEGFRDELRSGPPALARIAEGFGSDLNEFYDDAVKVVLAGLIAFSV